MLSDIPRRYWIAFGGIFAAMLYFVVWLGYRDSALYKAYDAVKLETPKEQYCAQLKVWNPDCKVE
jgi:hypothetical protein